jgi:hypothetical protein
MIDSGRESSVAQVGFIVHQVAILEPALGRSLAAIAVSLTTTMALTGRLCLGLVVDRFDPRWVTTGSLVTRLRPSSPSRRPPTRRSSSRPARSTVCPSGT